MSSSHHVSTCCHQEYLTSKRGSGKEKWNCPGVLLGEKVVVCFLTFIQNTILPPKTTPSQSVKTAHSWGYPHLMLRMQRGFSQGSLCCRRNTHTKLSWLWFLNRTKLEETGRRATTVLKLPVVSYLSCQNEAKWSRSNKVCDWTFVLQRNWSSEINIYLNSWTNPAASGDLP